jgi:hypothetical protein
MTYFDNLRPANINHFLCVDLSLLNLRISADDQLDGLTQM